MVTTLRAAVQTCCNGIRSAVFGAGICVVTTLRAAVQTCCNGLFSFPGGVGAAAVFRNRFINPIVNIPCDQRFDLRDLIQQSLFKRQQGGDVHDFLLPLVFHIRSEQIAARVQILPPAVRRPDLRDQVVGLDLVQTVERRFEARQRRRLVVVFHRQTEEFADLLAQLRTVQQFRLARAEKSRNVFGFDPADRQQLVARKFDQAAIDDRLRPQSAQHRADLRAVVDLALVQTGQVQRPAHPAGGVAGEILVQRVGQQQRGNGQRDLLQMHDALEQDLPFLAPGRHAAFDDVIIRNRHSHPSS